MKWSSLRQWPFLWNEMIGFFWRFLATVLHSATEKNLHEILTFLRRCSLCVFNLPSFLGVAAQTFLFCLLLWKCRTSGWKVEILCMEIFLLVQTSPSQAETYLFSIAKRRLSNAMDDSIIRYAIINSFSFKERVDFHTLKNHRGFNLTKKSHFTDTKIFKTR